MTHEDEHQYEHKHAEVEYIDNGGNATNIDTDEQSKAQAVGKASLQVTLATYDLKSVVPPKGLFDDDSASHGGDMWTLKKERKAGVNTKSIFDSDSDSGDLFSAK